MAHMSKMNIDLLKHVLVRLEGVEASEHVRSHLRDERVLLYLNTWVKPLLRSVIDNVEGNKPADDYAYMHRYDILHQIAEGVGRVKALYDNEDDGAFAARFVDFDEHAKYGIDC